MLNIKRERGIMMQLEWDEGIFWDVESSYVALLVSIVFQKPSADIGFFFLEAFSPT